MWIESTNQGPKQNYSKLAIGTLLYFAQKQVAQMMTAQSKMKTKEIGSHNHGAKNGLNTIEQFKDEIGDVQRFCDDFLVTHLPMNCLNNLKHTHTRDKGKSPLHASQCNFI